MGTFRFNILRSLVAICLLISLGSNAAENEQRLQTNITSVTVFLNQAQVTRTAKVSLQAGVTTLVLDKISPFINLNSIQVRTEGNATLLSVSQRNNFLKTDDKPKFITELEDTLAAIRYQLDLLRIKREALTVEKEVIAANKKIGGENTGLKIEDLEDALSLYRKRTQEIGEDLLKITTSEKKLVTLQIRFQAQLDEYLSNENNALEVLVTLKAISATKDAKIELSYLVANASWRPFYDIRVKDTKSPLQLVSKANITQGTGENWKNVILKLSTANPNESGSKPELAPIYLGYFEQAVGVAYDSYQQTAPEISKRKLTNSDKAERQAAPPLMHSPGIATEQQTAVNIEFNVTSAYNIPSDNNPHQVDLTTQSLEAMYAYASAPKLDKDAFVTAKVSGNDMVNQISGEANVYFDGTFVGKTYINGTTSDSLQISLGRDKRIQIQRSLVKDFSSKSNSGSSKKELSTWEISLRNTRKEPVIIVVEDQVPVSTDKSIEVKLTNAGGAVYDETTGKLTWTIKLDAEQSVNLRFSFEVKYPKDKQISDY